MERGNTAARIFVFPSPFLPFCQNSFSNYRAKMHKEWVISVGCSSPYVRVVHIFILVV